MGRPPGGGALSPYRALDLTDDKGFLCGRILADLVVDVIKIEPPGGDPSRRTPPFHQDVPDAETSLVWMAYNAGKRGITLDLASAQGRAIFFRLLRSADFILESYPPGHLRRHGLDYQRLKAVNRRTILVSITPFGQSGPYADYKATDIVGMAMGGFMYTAGDPDRPPVRVSVPQAYLHAAAAAAAGATTALFARARGGIGQHVDISMQECIPWAVMPATSAWDLNKANITRSGAVRLRSVKGTLFRMHWRCKDGFVTFGMQAGQMGGPAMYALAEWMEQEGFDPGVLREVEWEKVDWITLTQDELDSISAPIARFFAQRTRQQLYQGALERRIILYPVNTLPEVVAIPQLQARGFWQSVEHQDLPEPVTFPGPWTRFSQTPLRSLSPAPRIGQHNEEVYLGELGFSRDQLVALREQGVI